MSRERAQSLFSGAYEGDLSPSDQAEFETLLQTDDLVQSEYAAFRKMMRQTEVAFSKHPTPDLMQGVHKRLGNRKPALRGDRLGQLRGRGRVHPLMLACIAAAVLGLVWALFTAFQALQSTKPRPTELGSAVEVQEERPTTAPDSPAADNGH